DRSETNPDGKARMGALIARMIPDGSSIIIDNGSTTRAAVQDLIETRRNLIFYTNDLWIASAVSKSAGEVTLLGGKLDSSENATMGMDALNHLKQFHADYALVGVGGLSARAAFTDFSLEAANLRQSMMQQVQTPLILADQSKFNIVGQVVLTAIPAQTALITDTSVPDDIARELRTRRMEIHLA
ncbi:MAG: DeoR/GlpR family DNA-binding transcription regulator, partial [Paracoccaceae bacterium]